MAYPKNLLNPGEVVEMELRPHWRSIILPALWLALLLIAGIWLFVKLNDWFGGSVGTILRWALVIVGAIFLAAVAVKPLVTWWTTQYVFTNRRIIVRSGLFSRTGRDMPLSKINDVAFEHTAIERLFHSGTLAIESGGENGRLIISNVPDIEGVQREVYRLQEADRTERRGHE